MKKLTKKLCILFMFCLAFGLSIGMSACSSLNTLSKNNTNTDTAATFGTVNFGQSSRNELEAMGYILPQIDLPEADNVIVRFEPLLAHPWGKFNSSFYETGVLFFSSYNYSFGDYQSFGEPIFALSYDNGGYPMEDGIQFSATTAPFASLFMYKAIWDNSGNVYHYPETSALIRLIDFFPNVHEGDTYVAYMILPAFNSEGRVEAYIVSDFVDLGGRDLLLEQGVEAGYWDMPFIEEEDIIIADGLPIRIDYLDSKYSVAHNGAVPPESGVYKAPIFTLQDDYGNIYNIQTDTQTMQSFYDTHISPWGHFSGTPFSKSKDIAAYFPSLPQNKYYRCYMILGKAEGAMVDSKPSYYTYYFSNIVEFFYGEVIELPADPTKDGYDFVGWYYDIGFTQPYDGAPIFSDTDLYAKFTPIVYNITYAVNGGSLSGQLATYTIESSTITHPQPTKDGYTFGGWFTNADFTGNAVTTIESGSTGNKVVYARWILINYSITYNTNGGSLSGQSESYNIETNTITHPVPTRDGYSFSGWFTSPDYSGMPSSSIPKGSIGDKTFYAKWTLLEYSISYILNGGSLSDGAVKYTVESGSVTLPTPSLIGHDFLGWFTNAELEGESVTEIEAGSIGSKTFYASWQIRKYAVRFYVDGQVYKEIIVDYGTKLSGYYLVDPQSTEVVPLYINADMSANFDLNTMIVANVDVYAATGFVIYVSLTYIVDGAKLTTDLLEYNSSLDNLRLPSVEGYEFAGWFYDSSFKNKVDSVDKLTSNTQIYAKLVKAAPQATFWQRLGAWCKSPAGIIVLIITGLAGVGCATGFVIYKKKKA